MELEEGMKVVILIYGGYTVHRPLLFSCHVLLFLHHRLGFFSFSFMFCFRLIVSVRLYRLPSGQIDGIRGIATERRSRYLLRRHWGSNLSNEAHPIQQST